MASTMPATTALRRQVCHACRRVAREQQLPIASTSKSSGIGIGNGASSRRTFASSATARATMVIEDKLDKKDDPRDLDNLEEFKFDDIPWYGHLKLEKDRERLHFLRLIEFQFPEIHKLRQPYKAPPSANFIDLRSVFHLDDPANPASKKAVITVSVQDLIKKGQKVLQSKEAQHKFKLLAGQRWNPDTDTIKISCQDFPTFNMNAKWCSDVLDKMVVEANDATDTMADIPLDTRHAEARKRKKASRRAATIHDIPKEWLRLPKKSGQE